MGSGTVRGPGWLEAGWSIIRAGLAGAFALGFIFILAWIVAQLPYGPGNLFVALFSSAPTATTYALKEGALYASLLGFVAGALVSLGLLAFDSIGEEPR